MKNIKRLFLLFVILLAIPTIASASMGAKFGLSKDTKDNKYDANMTLIGIDYRFSALPVVDIIGTVEYSWKKYKILGIGNLLTVEGTRHFLTINASVVKPFEISILKPYAGIGYGFHAIGGTTPEDVLKGGTRNGTGFHLIGGLKVAPPALPISLYGEYRQYWTNISSESGRYYTMAFGVMLGF